MKGTPKGHNAVMQRRISSKDEADFFPTPPWATRALCEALLARDPSIPRQSVIDPAAGRGDMARPLAETFKWVYATDLFDYGDSAVVPGIDFLDDELEPLTDAPPDWIITNPPFALAEQFIKRSLQLARVGVAMFVRQAFLEGAGRYERIYSAIPPTTVLQFVERVPLAKGRLDRTASTATAYVCLVWWRNEAGGGTRLRWIPRCRARLERPGDYDGERA